ncbi:MAG: hypothetical protein AB1454_06845 [Candidatus Auribacterota bacterium]
MSRLIHAYISTTLRYSMLALTALIITAQLVFLWQEPGGFTAVTGALVLIACAVLLRKRIAVPQKRAVPILLSIGLAVRIISLVGIPNQQVSDFQIYHELASAMADGQGFAYTGTTGLQEDVAIYLNNATAKPPLPTAFRPIGYPAMLSIIYRIFGANPLYGKLFNLLLSLIAGICVYYLLLPIHRETAFFGSLLWLIYPTNILAANLLGTELPFAVALLAGTVLIGRISDTRTPADIIFAVTAGLLFGLATLIRPGLFIAACGAVALCIPDLPLRRKALLVLMFIICFAVMPALWGVRNYNRFGKFRVQSTNVGIELLKRTPDMSEKLRHSERYGLLVRKFNESSDEFQRSALASKIASIHFRAALNHYGIPGFFRSVLVPNFTHAWKKDSAILAWCNNSEFYSLRRPDSLSPLSARSKSLLQTVTHAGYLCVCLCALAGCFLLRKEWTPGTVCLSVYLLISALLSALFFGKPRFHFAPMTALFVFAGYFLSVLFRADTSGISAKNKDMK